MQFPCAAVAVDDDGGAGDGGAPCEPDRRRGRRRVPFAALPGGGAFQTAAYGRETCLVDLGRDQIGELLLLAGRGVEAGAPVPEGAVAVGHRLQIDLGHVVVERDVGIDDGVAEPAIPVRERQQPFADIAPVTQVEIAHAADLVGAHRVFQHAAPHDRVPAVVAVEIAQDLPYRRDRRVDHRAARHPDHQDPKRSFRASKAAWKTSLPIASTSSASAAGSQSNSAVHSAKVRSPSVTGTSFNVAM